MRLFRSLKVKTVLLALCPMLLVMAVFTVITYVAIQNTAREVFKQRDTELSRIAAARLAENLKPYLALLQQAAALIGMQSMEPRHVEQALENARSWLYIFDGGIAVCDENGRVRWARPGTIRQHGNIFPFEDKFVTLRRKLRPVFSDVFSSDFIEEDVILIAVPVVSPEGGFRGALMGMCTVKYSLLGVLYPRVLEFRSGRSGFGYLVDGNGRVLYHRKSSLVGSSLADIEPVRQVMQGKSGAVLTEDASGEPFIAGFAPVPGTGWGIVTHENWSTVSGPIHRYFSYFLILVWLGGLLSAILVFLFVSRVLKPIKSLNQGAQRIADGDFQPIRIVPTGDELEALARQFNTMAAALQSSFSSLEDRLVELSQTQAALKESKERFQLFMKHLPGRAFIQNLNGELVFANHMHQRMIESSSPVKNGSTQLADRLRDVMERRDVNGQIVYVGKIHTQEESIPGRKGRTEWLTYRFPVFEGDHPKFIGGIAIDITARKQAEEELSRHRDRLEELVRERTQDLQTAQEELVKNEKLSVLGQLTATVSHELRNPLAVMRSSIYYLRRRHSGLDAKTDAHFQRIEEQVDMCDAIVNELLDYTRMRQPDPVLGQINNFLDEVLDQITIPEHTILQRDFSPATPILPFDHNKLQRAVCNLIENALNAVDARREVAQRENVAYQPMISIRTVALPNGVRLEIVDNGIGMDPETATQAFEPLFTTRARGVGLGLAVVKQVADDHKGTVHLTSAADKGTRVILEIPRWGHAIEIASERHPSDSSANER